MDQLNNLPSNSDKNRADRLDRFKTVWSIAVLGAVCGIVATLIALGVELALR